MENTETQSTLRDDIAASVDAAVTASESAQTPTTGETEQPEITTTSTDRQRDEKGRFAPKQGAAPEQATETPPEQPERLQKPTTWKKEYLSLWDKIELGEPLTEAERKQHLEYLTQREREYAKGVSTYKTEAEQAKALFDRLSPAMSYLQQHNITPADFVGNLTQAHIALSHGTPQQKVAMFQQLAQSYGIHPQMLFQQGGESQVINDLMAKIHSLESEVANVNNWRNTQETSIYQGLINDFKASGKAPYLDDVAPDMAILLESGRADSLEAAYRMAVRMNDDIYERHQEQIRAEREKAESFERARAASVLPKSSSPKGAATAGGDSIRDILSKQIDAHSGRI